MSRDIGIDLGTANVLIHLKGRGIVVNEPSVVAIDSHTQEIIAAGKNAYDMIGRTSQSIEIVKPLKGGVIADFEVAEAMLTLFLEKIYLKRWFSKPNVLLCCPSNISDIETTSLIEAAERATGGNIYLEEEAKVAAIGSGIDIFSPYANMLIDIGGGTTDIAVVAGGKIIRSESLRIAGDDFDEAIIQYVKEKFNLLIGERTAEDVKKLLATALPLAESELKMFDLKGRDLLTGLPKSINVHANHICEAMQPQIQMIARAAKRLLEETTPEMLSDIIDQGIVLTGGGALISQIDTFLMEHLKVSVIKSDHAMGCVAIGTGLMLESILNGKIERVNLTKIQRLKRWLKSLKKRWIG
ncbi:rod shape-determining protein [Aerococcaceae bacterium zg-ZUI334]|uniref:rod shape-determining protein MreB n=1 Tax=Aerococcaceae bacterium zg-252 TaxID=2796928 RepID=UPI001B932A4D|nr:rod shape-determining protein [Aerococcaceae bacterium zg-ZUI334]